MSEDTYLSVNTVANSGSLRSRITACAAKESIPDPETWAYAHRWQYAAAPGWGAAFDSATASGNADPGADPAVITDGMILTQVQAMNGAGDA